MNKELKSFIACYAEHQHCLDSIVVSSFVSNNALAVGDGFLARYYCDEVPTVGIESIEDVINVFELAIPKREQTKNGAVYTPRYIRDYILERVISSLKKPVQECFAIDIACGCGAFLYTLADYMHRHCRLSYCKVVRRLFGVDVSELSVNRCKLLLSLAALQNGEILRDTDFQIIVGNSLDFDFSILPGIFDNGGFDIVVGNPPYVRAKHIDVESKSLLSRWQVARCGNADLYIPFFEIGLSILNEDGVMGVITLNSFFKSVNARLLRTYFRQNEIALELIDFGDQLVFGKKLAYTCIALVNRHGNAGVNYTKGQIGHMGFTQRPDSFNHIPYGELDDHKGWNLDSSAVLRNIRKIEGMGKCLGERYSIKNGIATLANDLYIFRPVREDEAHFYMLRDGVECAIERGICRDIIKPNILHSEDEIATVCEKVIFPYDGQCNVIAEDVFREKYPKAYGFLMRNKSTLDKRDKGKKTYEAWYAFGRTQAIGNRGRKLLFPYMAAHPHFVYTGNEDMLIYCGYAIFCDNEEELLVLKRILESTVFDYYMRHTAKPYASGYYSYAKNYVKGFGIPNLSKQQRMDLLMLQDKVAINRYVEKLYGFSSLT